MLSNTSLRSHMKNTDDRIIDLEKAYEYLHFEILRLKKIRDNEYLWDSGHHHHCKYTKT